MARQVGPFATIEEVQVAESIAKRIQPGAAFVFYLGLDNEKSPRKVKRNSTKKVVCPVCGEKFNKPQSLGPHSRKHRPGRPTEDIEE
jgi:hypothetical protein